MNSTIESLLEILYPEKNICCICGIHDESIKDDYICPGCLSSIRLIEPPVCIKCGKPLAAKPEQTAICRDYAIHQWHFEAARAVFHYEGNVKDCLHMLKYNNKPYYHRFFGSAMVKYIQAQHYDCYDLVTSVPIHRSRMRERGYNQSKLLAKYVASHTSKPYIEALKRDVDTPKQSTQARAARLRNLKGAFAPKNKKAFAVIKGLSVLLIDDIYTTGATSEECTLVLLGMGAACVYVLTAAR